MIKSVGFARFKSYDQALLPLGTLTLLIGANASGKTNCIEALRFLARLAHGQRIDDILEDVRQSELIIRGNVGDIVSDKSRLASEYPVIGFEVQLEKPSQWPFLYTVLEMRPAPLTSQVLHDEIRRGPEADSGFLYKTIDNQDKNRHEIQVAYNASSKNAASDTLACSNRQAIFTQLDVPSRFATLEAQKVIPAVVTEFQEALRTITFLDLNPRAMVKESFIIDKKLHADGRNVSSVLFDICETQGRKAEVLKFIGELPEQRISNIEFLRGLRHDVLVAVTENFGHTPVTREAPLLSDGTLRVLAVAAALLSAPTGGLVVIEEIDNGVHPSRAKALLANILAASKANSLRVLLTSHNPALLDTLPKEAVPDVVCCYRDPEQGDSRLIRLADLTDYPDLVARGPLGQLMTQGLLDRYLKNQRTPEQKAEQAQEWLRQLQLSDEEEEAQP